METVVCTIIFLLSVFYAAITYESVYDLARIEENMETIGEFDEVAFGKWKNEYAHPLVVGHIRKRDASQLRHVYQADQAADLENINQIKDQQNKYGNVVSRERNTNLFELTVNQGNKNGAPPPNVINEVEGQ